MQALKRKYAQAAIAGGSKAKTVSGQLRWLTQNPQFLPERTVAGGFTRAKKIPGGVKESYLLLVERRKKESYLLSVEGRKKYPEAKRAAAMGGGAKSALTRKLRQQAARLISADSAEIATRELIKINQQLAILGHLPAAKPPLRVDGILSLLKNTGWIPRKYDGCLIESVEVIDSPTPSVECKKREGEEVYWELSCRWKTYDHFVTWGIPRESVIQVVEGVVTLISARDDYYHAYNSRPVPCFWPEKGQGYSARWVGGFLYRGAHGRTESAVRALVTRRESADKKALGGKDSSTVWISAKLLAKCGACAPGINAARELVQKMLDAVGEIGAIRADFALSLGGTYRNWTLRALRAAK